QTAHQSHGAQLAEQLALGEQRAEQEALEARDHHTHFASCSLHGTLPFFWGSSPLCGSLPAASPASAGTSSSCRCTTAAGRVRKRTSPPPTSNTRLAVSITAARCATETTVVPAFRMLDSTRDSFCASKEQVASSRNNMLGSPSKAWARPSRCRSPPDRLVPRASSRPA